ncbi:sulfatase-like hydrolase/transferase, partial [bacterium]|nr:sulfatase-like hydrolase/transferase [bacterium]
MKFKIRGSDLLRETRRLALFGIFAGYVFLAFHLLSTWVIHGSPSGWDPLVSGFSGIVRNITALLFFYPAVACLANLIAGVLATLVTGFTRLDERGRFRVGVIVVAGISFALLGIPVDPGEMFVHIQTLLGYLIKLLLGAGFVWAALRWRRLGRVLSTAAGFTLGGVFLLWLLLVFAFPWNFSPGDPKDDDPPGPNILIVLSDAQRADVDSLYGGHVPTPNLERLAARGVTYENCFAPSSWTVPSVAAMFTGLAPEVSGMDGIRALPSTIEYLPKRLSEYGYRTWTSIGNSVLSRGIGFYRGFDYFAIYDWNFFGQGLLFDNWSSLYGSLTQRFCIFLNSLLHSYTGRLCPGEGLEMVRELNPAGGDFVYIHIMDPHRPYQPPERDLSNTDYEGRYREDSLGFTRRCDELTEGDIAQLKRLYEGEIRYVDEHVGRVLDILDERGLWTNTAVIFCAD